jgi:hypothetical protein
VLGALGSVLVGQAALKQVQLAAQAQAERRVQEGRDECDRCGDRHRGGEAEGCQEQPSTDDQQSDKLGEAWWAGVLQLGWRGQPGADPCLEGEALQGALDPAGHTQDEEQRDNNVSQRTHWVRLREVSKIFGDPRVHHHGRDAATPPKESPMSPTVAGRSTHTVTACSRGDSSHGHGHELGI